jgi:hypothetical protein
MLEMDPLGIILKVFTDYFTTPFVASALIIGYLMFFLFFYGTEYWNSIDWSERFFFGFLVGIFTVTVCTFVSIPLSYLLFALHMENLVTQIFYLVPGAFLMFLIFLRIERGAPLSSRRTNRDFRAFLQNHRSYWPWFLIVISLVTYLWLGWNNPFFDDASRALWVGLIFFLDAAVFIAFCLLAWLVVLFSCIPNKISWFMVVLDLPFKVLALCFFSFRRKRQRYSTREEDVYWV